MPRPVVGVQASACFRSLKAVLQRAFQTGCDIHRLAPGGRLWSDNTEGCQDLHVGWGSRDGVTLNI